jgi:uncharacterized protein DUF5818
MRATRVQISGRPKKLSGGSVKKTLLLTVILLLSATWVVAQTSTHPTPPSGNNAPTPPGTSDQMGGQSSQGMGNQGANSQNMGNETQMEGCLAGSSGSYTLTDASGTAWQLQGDDSQLSKHVGQQVRISGTSASPAAAGSGGAGGQMFNVTKVRKVANTCSGSMPSK